MAVQLRYSAFLGAGCLVSREARGPHRVPDVKKQTELRKSPSFVFTMANVYLARIRQERL